ncbi:hypothetical protein FRB97_003250 [Tulasnella sp. 331]|nr:hypothetical protein FRB97_003250 [Tulasnella sp. 331]
MGQHPSAPILDSLTVISDHNSSLAQQKHQQQPQKRQNSDCAQQLQDPIGADFSADAWRKKMLAPGCPQPPNSLPIVEECSILRATWVVSQNDAATIQSLANAINGLSPKCGPPAPLQSATCDQLNHQNTLLN